MPPASGPSQGQATRSSATVNAVAFVPVPAQPRQDPQPPADDRAPAPPLRPHQVGAGAAHPGETIEETPEPALQGTQLSLLGPATGRANELLTYAVVVENAQAVSHAPLRLAFDPGVLAFVEAAEGDFLSSDGSATQFLASAADSPGLVDIALSRLGAGPGVGGGGTICTVTFRVVGPGVSSIAMSGSRLLDASSRPVGFRRNDSHVAVD